MLKKLMIPVLLFSTIHCTYTERMPNESIQENIEILEPEKREMGMHCIPSLKIIYRKNKYQLLWTDKKNIDAFMDMVQRSGFEGLEPKSYHFSELKKYQIKKTPDITEKARFDMLLTDSFLLYATHLLSGKVDPTTINAQWHITRNSKDPIQLFYTSRKKKDMAAPFKTLLLKNKPYQKLKRSLEIYRKIQKIKGWHPIPKGPAIYPRKRDVRIPRIRKRLALTGDYTGTLKISSTVYNKDLLSAIKQFQKRHGLVSKGIIGKETLREMNIPIKKRIDQIVVNMERHRWLPQEFSDYYLLVNIADFMLEVRKDQRVVLSQKIIVGKPFKKTPAFSSKIYYLYFNPIWTIPRGIVKTDILPAMQKSTDYLTKRHITIFDNKRKPVDAKQIDWSQANLNNYLFRQEAGPRNTLGVVKFMLPNPFAIYLHDTPSKGLFERSKRTFSAGCIRLHRPIDLALLLLEDQPNWDAKGIRKAIASGVTQKVILTTRPDIHLIYLTAWVDENNTLQFRSDIYDRDPPLYDALVKDPIDKFSKSEDKNAIQKERNAKIHKKKIT